MTTTTTYKGMEPGSKSSSRVLRPPGGTSSISFGADDNSTPRKDKMASNIFAEPEDPHAHRRNNPPTGEAAGTLCGEPSAPLRRCQQPLLFPKNPEPELTTIHNSGAAMVWNQRREVPLFPKHRRRRGVGEGEGGGNRTQSWIKWDSKQFSGEFVGGWTT
uniref:Jupiter microtubule associated homolog 1b n=1 Tax=Gasterosteus aculeatus aculeatus TaxID=481459 RepID=A0AAQ4PAB5_GASAC